MTRFGQLLSGFGLALVLAWPLCARAGVPGDLVAGLSADGHAATFQVEFTNEGTLVFDAEDGTVAATISYRALPRPCALNAMCAPPAAPRGVFVDLPRHRVFVSRCRVQRPFCPADELFEVKLPGLEMRKVGTVTGVQVNEAVMSPSGARLALIDWQQPMRTPTLFVIELATGKVREKEISSSFGSCGDGICRHELTPSWADDQTVTVVIADWMKHRTERVEVSSMKPVEKRAAPADGARPLGPPGRIH